METWILKFVSLALLIQVAVTLPSFGTGDQIEQWNEVDDEHPGEKLPVDYMMPMRDPNGNNAEDSKPKVPEPSTAVSPHTKTEDSLPKPVPERLTTVRPQTKATRVDPVDKKETTEKETSVKETTEKETTEKEATPLPRTESEVHKPVIYLSITKYPLPHEQLPAPSPTPRPPTEGEEEDCECVECEEAIEKQKSGNGNGEEIDCQEPENIPTHIEGSGMKAGELSPLSLLSNGKKDETLEDVFRDVTKVMRQMTLLEKKQLFKSIPLSKVEEGSMGLQNEEEIPKIIAGIMMKVTRTSSNDEEDAPCDMEESNVQEKPSRERGPAIELSPFNRGHEAPVIKSILLRSLLPRSDLLEAGAIKANIHNDVNKKVKMITSLNDIFRDRVNKQGRFIALQNEGYTGRLPSLHFPYEDEESFARESGLSDIQPIFRQRPSENEFVSRLIKSLKTQRASPMGPPSFNSFNGLDEYNDHVRKLDPQIKGLMDVVLKRMAEHEAASFDRIGVQMPVGRI